MKRFIAVLVCIFMLVSLLPTFAFATDGEPPETEGGGPTPTPTAEPTVESAPTQELTPTPTAEPTQEPTPTPDGTAKPETTPEATPTEQPIMKAPGAPKDVSTYTVSVSATKGGSASGGKAGLASNGEITVTATANTGYKFVKWTENNAEVSTSASYTFNVTADRMLVAVFEADTAQQDGGTTYTVTVDDGGNGTAAASPASGTEGTEVTLSATPNEGYVFKEWQVVSGGVTISGNKFTIGTANVEIKAIFEE